MDSLKKIFLGFSLLFVLSAALADTADSALSRLLSGYHTYQADFSQVNYEKKNKPGQKSQGKIYMSRPGKFRWATTQPYEQILIANGNTLWIYDVDLKQATQQSLAKRGFNPAELLTAPAADLTQKYNITQEGDWFKLTPKQDNGGFKFAYLQFQNGKLTGLKILNQLNQTNTFTFTDVRINPALDPALFQFKPPAGVQVLKE